MRLQHLYIILLLLAVPLSAEAQKKKKAAVKKYLATIEGKNFVLTNLVAEVANSYYELIALDNQLAIVRQNILLQQNALETESDPLHGTQLARHYHADARTALVKMWTCSQPWQNSGGRRGCAQLGERHWAAHLLPHCWHPAASTH